MKVKQYGIKASTSFKSKRYALKVHVHCEPNPYIIRSRIADVYLRKLYALHVNQHELSKKYSFELNMYKAWLYTKVRYIFRLPVRSVLPAKLVEGHSYGKRIKSVHSVLDSFLAAERMNKYSVYEPAVSVQSSMDRENISHKENDVKLSGTKHREFKHVENKLGDRIHKHHVYHNKRESVQKIQSNEIEIVHPSYVSRQNEQEIQITDKHIAERDRVQSVSISNTQASKRLNEIDSVSAGSHIIKRNNIYDSEITSSLTLSRQNEHHTLNEKQEKVLRLVALNAGKVQADELRKAFIHRSVHLNKENGELFGKESLLFEDERYKQVPKVAVTSHKEQSVKHGIKETIKHQDDYLNRLLNYTSFMIENVRLQLNQMRLANLSSISTYKRSLSFFGHTFTHDKAIRNITFEATNSQNYRFKGSPLQTSLQHIYQTAAVKQFYRSILSRDVEGRRQEIQHMMNSSLINLTRKKLITSKQLFSEEYLRKNERDSLFFESRFNERVNHSHVILHEGHNGTRINVYDAYQHWLDKFTRDLHYDTQLLFNDSGNAKKIIPSLYHMDVSGNRFIEKGAIYVFLETFKRINRWESIIPGGTIPGTLIDEEELIWLMLGKPNFYSIWDWRKFY
ncbi:hypothetical protein LC040_12085 [Bacillus tianshenii]|nr:hypothetical protein LC040_12085 [Bacillus tianshenii]